MILNGKIMKAGQVVGFEVIKDDGTLTKVRESDIKGLAEKGLLDGVEPDKLGIFEKGYIIDPEVYCKLGISNERYEIIGRIVENEKTVGYEVKSVGTSKITKISIDKAWELAFDRLLKGAKANFVKDTNRKILVVAD